ncbi:NfeD family protein [Paenibacillus flagellatus]|uniref:NfeD family protein n=1 Tax=Paenibacillus flagellatus TaxID=2211139 RepID=A0A2V5KWY8_9BACL|nr:NfeD family protein [Paenibacillus flagellatus]PYI54226.1 NfeD family protein [Paenibacillus flagellatus]
MELWALWLIAAGVLVVVEMLTLTFYLLWFGLGALAAAIVAWLMPDAFALQALVGCAVVALLTVFTKPITRRFRPSRGYRDAVDDLVGKQGIVVEEVADGKPGIVKVGSETWSATSNERLVKGEAVIVVRRGSAVLEVQKWGGRP